MKAFWKKFKKTKLSTRLVYLFVLLLFLVSYIFLFVSLIRLSNIETGLRIFVLCLLGVLLFAYWFMDLLLVMSKHHKSVLITSFIAMLISIFSIIGGSAVNKVYNSISNMEEDSKVLYTTNLVVMKDTEFVDISSFKVGMINNETDVEGNILPNELIKKEKLSISVQKYDTYFELLESLYSGELNGIFITSNYVIIYEGYDQYKNIREDTKVVKEYSKKMENQDTIDSGGSVTDPFTVLIMGVDSEDDTLSPNAAFNGDTLMLVTFNPHTLNATVFSIPRDTYVPIACLRGGSSKINSSAAYGNQCVINTIQNLVDIKIDYYVKVNFKGVVDLVEALGGIDITVPDGIDFCEQNSKRSKKGDALQCIRSGYQHMNGEQALAFARHRYTLATGDFARVQHQQLVVEAMAKQLKNLKSVNDFYSILDAVSANLITNMSTKEMLNLYNVFKSSLSNANSGDLINIQKTYLTGYGLTMYVDNLRLEVYTFQYYEQSLSEIKQALKENLEIVKPSPIKTFNFSVNDPYEVPVIGQKYYSVQRKETLPSFVLESVDYAEAWLDARDIKYTIINITKDDPEFDDTVPIGTVIRQDVPEGKLTDDVSHITLYVTYEREEKTTTTSDEEESTSQTTTDNSETSTESTTSSTTAESSGG